MKDARCRSEQWIFFVSLLVVFLFVLFAARRLASACLLILAILLAIALFFALGFRRSIFSAFGAAMLFLACLIFFLAARWRRSELTVLAVAIFASASALVFLLLCVSAEATLPEASWEAMGDRDGIKTFRQEIPGSPVLAFKGIGTIHAPIAKVASVLLDDKRTPEWVDSVKETRIVLTISKTEVIAYTYVKTPFVMKDREFVTRVRLDIDRAAKTVDSEALKTILKTTASASAGCPTRNAWSNSTPAACMAPHGAQVRSEACATSRMFRRFRRP